MLRMGRSKTADADSALSNVNVRVGVSRTTDFQSIDALKRKVDKALSR